MLQQGSRFDVNRMMLPVMFLFATPNSNTFSGDVQLTNTQFENVTIDGNANLKGIKLKSLIVRGSLIFRDLKISSALSICGAASGQNVTCQTLQVSGSLTGKNIQVCGITKIFGGLYAEDSNFSDLEINSDTTQLTNTNAKTIVIKPVTEKTQKLILKGRSIVSGDIIFEAGNGEVRADKNVKIIGRIRGGKIL